MIRRGPFLLLFGVSGAAALIYEVVWTRLLTLHMGHGLAAASAVLAAFMGGLALGAGTAGRYALRLSPARALAIYAALEIAIGALALLLPLLLAAVRPLLGATYADGDGGPMFAFVRLASSVVLLSVPSACMGATFPIASRWVVRTARTAAVDAGALYAANTFGAAAGAVLAGFLLIPALGLQGTTLVGVVLNVAAAAGAWVIAQRAGPAEAGPPQNTNQTAARSVTKTPWLAAAALGASGFASLTLQVVWTRLLVQILGPTTYAFSTVVAIFIVGIALGATAGSALAARVRQPAAWLAGAMLLSGALAIAAASGVDWAMLTIGEIVSRPDTQFGGVLVRQILLVAALLLPMTVAFGATFPFAVALAGGRDDELAEHLGVIYAVNTLGAILGSLLAGFLLIPAIGLHDTIRLTVAVSAVTAVVLIWRGVRATGRAEGTALAILVFAALALAPGWDRSLLSSGAYKYAPAMRGPGLETSLTAGELLSYREGSTSTVAVRKLAGTLSLAIDGKVDASNAGDMLTQRLLAHVPLLLHPNPTRAAILGLGSGVTLGSALTHPLIEATVLEISPDVVEGSRFFEAENHRALADARTRLIVGDGRTHLMLGRQTYDVIVSEPSNPWMAGIASLFTREFFQGARDRLAPGGLLCQWAHTYDISDGDLRSIVNTFLSVFPDGTMWLVGEADVLLIGSTGPLDARIGGVAAAMQRRGVAADLATVGIQRPFSIVSTFVAQGAALKSWANSAPLQTDDRSALEFSGPRSIFGASRDDNATALRTLAAASPKPPAVAAALAAATPEDWRDRGLTMFKADAFQRAFDDLSHALNAQPDDPAALEALVRAAASVNKVNDAQAFLQRLSVDPSHASARLALSHVLASQNNIEGAMQIPSAMLQANPTDVPALEQLASILADIGDAARLDPIAQRLLQAAPTNAWAHYYSASLFFLQERTVAALQAARNAVALDPNNAKAHNLIGASLATMGQTDGARAAFETSIRLDGKEPGTYANLATLELQSGNTVRARQYFAEALAIDPNHQAARSGLNSIR